MVATLWPTSVGDLPAGQFEKALISLGAAVAQPVMLSAVVMASVRIASAEPKQVRWIRRGKWFMRQESLI